MRFQLILPLLLAVVRAAPTSEPFVDYVDLDGGVLRHAVDAAEEYIEHIIHDGEEKVEKWMDLATNTEFVRQDGIVCKSSDDGFILYLNADAACKMNLSHTLVSQTIR
jgi:hypothetical protein